jgi:hypothetical protein
MHAWEEFGNANLPIGVFHGAIQENGVPGMAANQLYLRGGFLFKGVVRRAHQGAGFNMREAHLLA